MNKRPKTPELSVDIIIERGDEILLIERKFPPHGWALPGGFVDVGETVEAAAIREAKEETDLDINLQRQFHLYSDPGRDPRGHTASMVFIASASGEAKGGDDAQAAKFFLRSQLPTNLCFDHSQILRDYLQKKY